MCDIYFSGIVLGKMLDQLDVAPTRFSVDAGLGHDTVPQMIRENGNPVYNTRKKIVDCLDLWYPNWKETDAYKDYLEFKRNPSFDVCNGKNLKELLSEIGETQTHFAALCGVSQPTIGNFINGKRVTSTSYKLIKNVFRDMIAKRKKSEEHSEQYVEHSEQQIVIEDEPAESVHIDQANTFDADMIHLSEFDDDLKKKIEIVCSVMDIDVNLYFHKCIYEATFEYFNKIKGAIE